MASSSFFFISSPEIIEFSESKKKPYARIEITACELDTISNNGRVYRFAEREALRKSLIGKSINWGITAGGEHKKKTIKAGFVESARIVGKQIKAILMVTAPKVLKLLKKASKDFLFSIGGVADRAKLMVQGAKKFLQMVGAKITHLQMWKSSDPSTAGFPSAKIDKVVEFHESMLIAEPIVVCDNWSCSILENIRKFEEAKRIMDDAEEKAINMALREDIAMIIRSIMKEPWVFIERKS